MTTFGSFPCLKSSGVPTSSMGTSSRFPKPKPTPGPGDYQSMTPCESQYASTTSLPFGSKSRSQKQLSSSASLMGPVSMFGAQVQSEHSSAPSPSFGLARRVTQSSTPGPGDFVSSFAKTYEMRERTFGSEERFNLATPSPEQQTPGPHSAGLEAIGPGYLSDWPNAPSFSFAGKSCEAKLLLGDEPSKWRSQGIYGRASPGPFSHDIPVKGNEMSFAPTPTLKGPFVPPKPRLEPHAQTYTPLSLYWDGRSPLGRTASAPRGLLAMTSKPNLSPMRMRAAAASG